MCSARALSEPEELIDYASQDADRSQYYDNVSQSMAKLTSFIDSINEKEGDPRALRVCSKEIEKLRKKLEKGSSQTIGSGGLAGGRCTSQKKSKSKARSGGKENERGTTKKKKKKTVAMVYS
jgi:aminopeptidase N